jgi:hypothetical protein
MSRTYRRRGQRHDYDWVLRDFCWVNGVLVPLAKLPMSRPLLSAPPFGKSRVCASFTVVVAGGSEKALLVSDFPMA